MKTSQKYYVHYALNNYSERTTSDIEFASKRQAEGYLRSVLLGGHFQDLGNYSYGAVTDEKGVCCIALNRFGCDRRVYKDPQRMGIVFE